MRKILAIVLTCLIATPSYGAGPLIWSGGGQAKGLNAGGITLQNGHTLSDTGPSNLIANGAFEDPSTAGWATYDDGASAAPVDGTGGSPANITAIAQDTTTADLIDGRGTAQLVKAAANAQGQGWSYDFTLPTKSALVSSLVSLSFDYYMSVSSVSDVMRVYLYDKTNSTLITPTFVSCGGGATPSLASVTVPCHAELAWLSTTSVSYRLIFHTAATSTTAVTTFVDNIYTGQYRSAVGPNVGPAQLLTFTLSNFGNGTQAIYVTRVGEFAEIQGVLMVGSSVPTGAITLAFPSGYTISPEQSTSNCFGAATASHSSAFHNGAVAYSSGSLVFVGDDGANVWNATNPITFAAADLIAFSARVRISEFVGSSAIGENKVEYAYNTSGTTSAGGSDTTSFATGAVGAAIGSIASTTVTGSSKTSMRVRFLTPIQANDLVVLEFDVGADGTWIPAGSVAPLMSYTAQGAAQYGVGLTEVGNGTDFDVLFGNGGRSTTNTSYAAAGLAWSGLSTSRWHVKKSKSNVPVGFGLVAPGSTPGLVPATGLPGNVVTTYACNSYPTGIVGECFERISTANTSITSGTTTDIDSTGIPLTPGTWDITGSIQYTPGATTSITRLQTWVGTATGNVTTGQDVQRNFAALSNAAEVPGANIVTLQLPTWRVSISVNTSYFLKANATFTLSTLTGNGLLRATRAL